MFDQPVLDQLALGYSPIIDRQRGVVATRLTLFPERADAPLDVAALMQALQEVWPAPAEAAELKLTLRSLQPQTAREGGAGRAAAPAFTSVSLNIAGEALLDAVMQSTLVPVPKTY